MFTYLTDRFLTLTRPTPTVASDVEVPTAVLPSIKQTSRSQMRQLYSNWMRADTDKDTHLTAMYVFKKLKKKSFIALGLSDFQVKKIQEGRDTQIFLAIRPRHWG